MHRILIVDDDESIRASLADALIDDGADVHVAGSAEEALSRLAEIRPAMILSDVRMGGMDGLELLRLVRERARDVDVVLMTAYDDMPTVVRAMREGAIDFLVKPLDLHDLRRVVDRVFADRKTRGQARRDEDVGAGLTIDGLIGRDAQMIAAYKVIGQVAASRANVLIRGESGTGKELIARAVHFNSADAAEPFVAVNCTALPSGLLESELFGHEKGSFTGAIGARRGRFALAGRGTIFLDEIGDTTLEFQAKLLRVLENREFYAVGAEKPERAEARVVAATHRDLEEMVATGRFRADLYYRLRVVEIRLPPLRERLGDLPHLAKHLVERASRNAGRAKPPVISAEAMEVLMRRPWPGNVRELDNCLTRAVVLASGEVIRPEHVSATTVAATAANAAELGSLAEMEKRHITQVLAATQGHKARAAEILGVSRPRLNRLLEKYGLGDGEP
jgi:DNA-binding NtrC family response regulator